MKITVLTSRYPYPLDKGDKLRAYHQLVHLAAHHQVQLLCIVDQPPTADDLQALEQINVQVKWYHRPSWRRWLSAAMSWTHGLPAQVGYFFSSRIKQQIYQEVISYHPDVIYCQLIRMAAYVRHLPYPKVMDYMDCFSAGLGRQAVVQPRHKSWIYRQEATLVRRYERAIRSDFEAATIISERDRDELPLLNKAAVRILANGINTSHFQPSPHQDRIYDVVFVGNLGYTPNAQAVKLLHDWREAIGDERTTYLIAGADPSREMLSQADVTWTVPGWMDDIRDAYRSSRVFVAPLTTGSGLQNKLLEAMACGLPCITTELANASMHAVPGQDLLIAHDAASYSMHLRALLDDKDYRRQIGDAGRTFVLNHYRWEVFNTELEQVLIHAKDRYHQLQGSRGVPKS